MKKMFKLFAFLLLGIYSSANSQEIDNWKWLNPKPQGNTLYSIDFVNDNTGYAAGDFGTILKTTNNGSIWENLNTGVSTRFLSIDFIDLNTGYAGGQNQMFKKTTNSGQTWSDIQLPAFENSSIMDINFINSNIGYVLGFFIFESRIWKTTDGGSSWSTQTTDGANYLNNLYFLDENNGFGSGGSLGGEIIKTTNGGATWDLIYQDNYKKFSMIFLNATTGFSGSEEGRMYKTTDAGDTWNFALSDGGIDVMSLNFIDANTGFGFGSGSVYIKTTDGGNNWYESQPIGSSNSSQYFDAAITPNGTIHAAGSFGSMVRSTNGGADFTFETSLTDGYVSDIEFVNATTGYAVTGFNHGDILKTTDAGASWDLQTNSNILSIYGIAFTSEQTGYLAGSLTIYKTTNGGIKWDSVYISTTNEIFTDVFFTNANTGYVIGSYGRQLKTTDAGATWTPSTISSSGTLLSSIYFVNENNGFAVGDNNAAVRTTNAGASWTSMSVATPFTSLNNIFFTDESNGYISSATGIYRTTNSGNTWSLLATPAGGYAGVQFRGNIGYAIAGNGTIIKSIDAGVSWIVQPTVTNNGLSALYFNSDNYIYAGGLLGTLLKTIPTELI
ncbi:MAG: YCF48-related protein, partial [bacterium]